ncbi:leucine-rich repeat domain-containing protein [Pasteurella skyensis]|uniref:Leucine-rich repeat domain-containing protein n=1 Tax=Phocoenobacter skyensis TaxID=97481 RepID=A0AAJ6P3G5_9PAST|nr:leucine-rich repeat domain-containing protein [Pasteurella skyensis]MDP8171580.1 leucine-rich repeat domain-containing protein [Pasteurella skyensis]MDP8175847.1 leucine-rich repeat domain-containing protein [Pasteurella skyensis]
MDIVKNIMIALLFAGIVGVTNAQTVSKQPYIEFTTSKKIGEKVQFFIVADSTEQKNIWIDLNNNGKREKNEGVKVFTTEDTSDSETRVIKSQTFRIYGKVNLLDCSDNQFTNINISHNQTLKNLYCKENQLIDLDVSQNSNLEEIVVSSNKLTSINFSKNKQLKYLDCSENEIKDLDVSKNIELEYLDFSSTQVKNIDLSYNIKLIELNCSYSELASLDVSRNTELDELFCHKSKLTYLDVSKNNKLDILVAQDNELSCIKISQEQLNHLEEKSWWTRYNKNIKLSVNCN